MVKNMLRLLKLLTREDALQIYKLHKRDAEGNRHKGMGNEVCDRIKIKIISFSICVF